MYVAKPRNIVKIWCRRKNEDQCEISCFDIVCSPKQDRLEYVENFKHDNCQSHIHIYPNSTINELFKNDNSIWEWAVKTNILFLEKHSILNGFHCLWIIYLKCCCTSFSNLVKVYEQSVKVYFDLICSIEDDCWLGSSPACKNAVPASYLVSMFCYYDLESSPNSKILKSELETMHCFKIP